MKTCFKCKKEKDLGEFYTHPMMKDGHLNKCKECNKKDVSQNYRKNIDHYKKYERSRLDDESRREQRKIHSRSYSNKRIVSRNYELRNPEKIRAHDKVYKSIKSGLIKKSGCVLCGNEKVEGHHIDYDFPLCVVWLCKRHHGLIHRKDV